MNTQKMTQKQFKDTEEMREYCERRLAILDKVKKILCLPNDRSIDVNEAAYLFEVPEKTIRMVTIQNLKELEEDGTIVLTAEGFVDFMIALHSCGDEQSHDSTEPINSLHPAESASDHYVSSVLVEEDDHNYYIHVIADDGFSMEVEKEDDYIYTKRAILRIGMLLEDSDIARECRVRLLSI